MQKKTIALATCAALPNMDPDDQLLLEALRSSDVDARAAVWDDGEVDWAELDLCVIRNTWDYPRRRAEFLEWTRRVPRLANPAHVIAWNTDKHYLAELAAARVPVVQTDWLSPGDNIDLPSHNRYVLKPSIGAGSVDAAVFDLGNDSQRAAAREHAELVLASGRTVMVQPYAELIEQHGETKLMYFAGKFSHAVVEGPMLTGEHGLEAGGLYTSETIEAAQPTPAQLKVGAQALASIPGASDPPLYARVDLVPDADGRPVLIELELTEPSLYFGYRPGSVQRFAEVIVDLLSRTN